MPAEASQIETPEDPCLIRETQQPESRGLSIEDARVRTIRNRLWAAKAHLEDAMAYVMFSETREALRKVQAELAEALAFIGR